MTESATATWSLNTTLAARTICPKCRHLHRAVIAKKCSCCQRDIAGLTWPPDRGGDR